MVASILKQNCFFGWRQLFYCTTQYHWDELWKKKICVLDGLSAESLNQSYSTGFIRVDVLGIELGSEFSRAWRYLKLINEDHETRNCTEQAIICEKSVDSNESLNQNLTTN